jgi:hypothetical protein
MNDSMTWVKYFLNEKDIHYAYNTNYKEINTLTMQNLATILFSDDTLF